MISSMTVEQLATLLVDDDIHRGHGGALNEAITVMGLAEEVGEFVQAYRRWTGLVRKSGTHERMADELADVIIVAHVVARYLGIDLDNAVAAKVTVIAARRKDGA